MTSESEQCALIIFAKEPQDGKVKTRLINNLPTKKVTQIYKAFVKDVISMALRVPCQNRFLYYSTSNRKLDFLSRFKRSFQLRQQRGKDLGQKMVHALHWCQQQGYGKIVIIGTDCLTIKAEEIQSAFRKLGNYDCVIGPSKDGGYYLIGLNKLNQKLFQNIKWSTSEVLDQTLTVAKECGMKVQLLKEKNDIDTYDSLKSYFQRRKKNLKQSHSMRTLYKVFSDLRGNK